MAQTTIAWGDPLAQKKFSAVLAYETFQKSFWGRNFMSTDGGNVIHRITDLERMAGDTVSIDLFNQLLGTGIEGDNTLRGNEEALTRESQDVKIDQLRWGVNLGGRMSRKRTVHDLRMIGKSRLTDWTGRRFDEDYFCYLSGDRGSETANWILPTSYTGRAGNTFQAHYTGTTANATVINHPTYVTGTGMASGQTASKAWLDQICYTLQTMENPPLPVTNKDGEPMWILLMDSSAEQDLRADSGTNGWPEISKFRGSGDDPFKARLGTYRNLILYSNPRVVKKVDPVAGTKVQCYNLVLGAQSGVHVGGSVGGGMTAQWIEETEDRQNVPVITIGFMYGIQRVVYESDGYGCLIAPTYYADTIS